MKPLLLSLGLILVASAASAAGAESAAPTKTVVIPKGQDGAYDNWGYAPAIRVGDTVIVSGIPAAGPGDYADKVRRMFERAKETLAAAGATMDDVVELTSFHTGAKDTEAFQKEFETLHKVHSEFFPGYKPAWTAVGTTALLAQGAVLEMRFVAVVGSGRQIRVERQGGATRQP
jgi:enamine deaminase RidA (YjgF/YER057c/UK114 family)